MHKSSIFCYRRISLSQVQLQKQSFSAIGLRRDIQSLVSARKILSSLGTHREAWGAQWNTSLTWSRHNFLLQLHHQPIYAHADSSSKFLTGITDGKRATALLVEVCQHTFCSFRYMKISKENPLECDFVSPHGFFLLITA